MSDEDHDLLARGTDALTDRAHALDSALTSPGENRAKQWLLLTGSRLKVSAVLLATVFLSLLALALVRPIELRDLLTETNAAITLFSSLLGGAILLVSVVVSINSIVLSQEITDIENQQERIDASIDYRRHIEGIIEADVTPARPGEFLRAVLYSVSRRMAALHRTAEESSVDGFEADVEAFGNQVADEVDLARTRLRNAHLGSFEVLLAGLNYNYSRQLHAARSLKRRFGDQLSDEEEAAVDELIDALQHIATGREYFKSLYHKRELARLSSILLYVALPVIVFTSYVILALDANLFPDIGLFGLSPLLLSVAFAYTVALAPFIVLTAFVVRTATITLRTLSAGPFILQPGGQIGSSQAEEADEGREWDLSEQLQKD